MSDGSLRSLANWSGCWNSACMPFAVRLRVVSLPATESSRKKRSISSSESTSPSISAWVSAVMMSSRGLARRSSTNVWL